MIEAALATIVDMLLATAHTIKADMLRGNSTKFPELSRENARKCGITNSSIFFES